MSDPTQAIYAPVTLLARWTEAPGLWGLKVSLANTEIPASYTRPGQYVRVRVGEAIEGFFAIASGPHDGAELELLVKAGGAAADALIALPEGARFKMSPAMGRGYPIDEHRGRDILLFAVGSGISAIRSLIGYLAHHRRDFADITLFFGARTSEDFAYQDELADWEAEGIRVVRVVSRESSPGFVRGYVQDALAAHPLEPARAVAFVCGMKAMVEGVSRELQARGMAAELVFQNH